MFAYRNSDIILILSLIFLNVQLNLLDISAQQHSLMIKPPLLNRQGRAHSLHHKVLRQAVARKLPHSGACECMDYWDCVSNNGQIYSYCGISDSEVCCFNVHKDNIDNRNNGISIVTSTTSSLTERIEDVGHFTTGNGIPSNDFVTGTPTPISTISSDVDYFFSLEDGTGDLKRLQTTESSAKGIKTNAEDGEIFCGRQDIAWNLDSTAQFKEWPWHVALLEIQQDLYICGGTLISHDKLITAAHCVNPYIHRRNVPGLKVRAGEYDVSTNNEPYPYVEALVDRIFIHPDFNNASLANDIAVVYLSRPINFTSNIQPICLPKNIGRLLQAMQSAGRSLQNQCMVAGWGRISEVSAFSVTLKEIVAPLWSHAECEERLRKNFGANYKLSETALCAGARGHDACDGDGGGGFVCYDEGRTQWNLFGVVSFGIGCGSQDTPGVYTSIPSFLNWINNVS